MYQIEIKYNKDNEWFELWQHILNVPKDILFPVKYSNFIDFDTNKKYLVEKAVSLFNIKYYQIIFTNG